ncbi:MAG: hypothetical protein M5U34_24600 [Chloroflexi bacterium]|nr:hypothetical protein [Chloroflexota bacterium]
MKGVTACCSKIWTGWLARRGRLVFAASLPGRAGRVVGTDTGVCEGRIALEPAGTGGFGYDPVFLLPERGLTMAQLPASVKHQISHRGRALRAIEPLLRQWVEY